MQFALLQALNVERHARRACVLITNTADGTQRLVLAADIDRDPIGAPLEALVRSGKSGMLVHEGASLFVTVHNPPARLILIGAVHISQALAPMARLVDFDVTVIDPRTAFASPERFADVRLLAQWPDEALASQPLDRFSAIALLTHDPKIDDPALIAGLSAECFYIGALGSRKTHSARIGRMSAHGFAPHDLSRIHAPIGLDIGAVSPAEIASSILAEIILSLRKKPLRTEGVA